MGINLAALGEVLGDGEEVLRGLNPKHCQDGLPTEGCFILKPHDPPDDGPSFGILVSAPEPEGVAPIGAHQGITPGTFETLLPSPEYGVAQLNVGRALREVRGRGVRFLQQDDEDWNEHRSAHAMLTGYQALESRTRKDLQRYLAKIASEAVLKKAGGQATR